MVINNVKDSQSVTGNESRFARTDVLAASRLGGSLVGTDMHSPCMERESGLSTV